MSLLAWTQEGSFSVLSLRWDWVLLLFLSGKPESYLGHVLVQPTRRNMAQYSIYLQYYDCFDQRIFQDSFEMQVDAIKPGQTVVVIDDLLATGMQNQITSLVCTSANHWVPQEGLLRLRASSSLNKVERHSSTCSSLNFCSWKAPANWMGRCTQSFKQTIELSLDHDYGRFRLIDVCLLMGVR